MPAAGSTWTFLTNHTHVLVCLWEDPDLRIRDLAVRSGITERAVQRIVHELVEEGYLELVKEGRRNHYRIVRARTLRHPLEASVQLGTLLTTLTGRDAAEGEPALEQDGA